MCHTSDSCRRKRFGLLQARRINLRFSALPLAVSFRFEEGAEGKLHNHPHVQSTYVQSGRFAFTVAGEDIEVGPGDSFVIPSNAMHGCRCLEPGTLIDTFTPRRDDFL